MSRRTVAWLVVALGCRAGAPGEVEAPAEPGSAAEEVSASALLTCPGLEPPATAVDADLPDCDGEERRAVCARRCELGSAGACTGLADLRRTAGDAEGALRAYRRGCAAGSRNACTRAAYAYEEGHGTESDPRCAAAYFAANCAIGGATACQSVGLLLRQGALGLAAAPEASVPYFERGCVLGDIHSCFQLGQAHVFGLGVPRDDARGAAILLDACEAGEARSCDTLGRMTEQGRGVPQDHARALLLLERACRGYVPEACAELCSAGSAWACGNDP
jgi:TPR repeat protein